ncbi:GATA transcription factor 15 [Cucumis sativus]|uniref:GATA-type domain-containing protein n=1 Tax=Cucumis sativus TaxID=3659 RepID=A0A0A0K6B1_CUCSA|nr:GATA transcription factor 15 [Cucumis sativus]KGN44993.1 hypothetical protein Csa_016706 [Cucumis sativus]
MLKGEVIGDFGLDCLMIAFLMNRAADLSASTFNPPSLMTAVSKEGLLELEAEKQRACVHCRATRTPLWRAGPAGPRSLCNACGIRYRKMKMNSNNNGGVNNNSNNKMGKGKKMGGSGGSLKVRVVRLGREIMVHRPTTAMEDDNEVAESIGEEEQTAALLLMALSSGYV